MSLRMSTVAPGTTAPDWLVTVPVTVPVLMVCAGLEMAKPTSRYRHKEKEKMIFITERIVGHFVQDHQSETVQRIFCAGEWLDLSNEWKAPHGARNNGGR